MCDRKTEPNFSMGERIVTNHMPGTLDPEWNQSFMLAVKEAASLVQFRVFDKNNMTKDRFMGIATMSTAARMASTHWFFSATLAA